MDNGNTANIKEEANSSPAFDTDKRVNGFITALPIKIIAWILFTAVLGAAALGVIAVVFMTGYDFYTLNLTAIIDNFNDIGFNIDIFPSRSAAMSFIETLYNNRIVITLSTVALLVALIFLFVYLLWSSGRSRGDTGVRLCAIDRMPFDLFACVVGFLVFLCLGAAVQIRDYGYYYVYSLGYVVLAAAAILTAALLLMWILVSFSARVKASAAERYGKWWRNTVIYGLAVILWKIVKWALGLLWKFVKWLFKGLGGLFGGIAWLLGKIPMFWKAVAVFSVYSIISAFAIAVPSGGDGVFMWLLLQFAAASLIIFVSWQAHLLSKAGENLAAGELDSRVSTKHMTGGFKRHGENLNHIVDGMEAAVAERLKNERLRTELITNVSHDIKTPLTSIINYTDLLSREELSNETAKGYVEVIARQSQRLRKLTEDVVEASKASSGAIVPELAPTDAAELLTQCAGEYSEKFAAAGIEPVLNVPDKPLIITADGRLLWRVFDNLLGNVVKYSLSGTRVYITAAESGGKTVMSVRNISREPLNISADELTERFVRGDISRSTEGSGLGLSIAQSLTKLMGGELTLHIDGDLFKAQVSF